MKKEQILQKKVLYPLLIALLIAVVFLFPALTRTEVTTAVVQRGHVREYVFEDETETRLDVIRTIYAPLGGTLRRIELEVGDAVKAGQVVTTIEDDEIMHAIAGAEAKVRELEARIQGLPVKVPKESELKAAEEAVRAAEESGKAARLQEKKAAEEREYQSRQYRRVSGLHEKNVASDEQYDRAKLRFALARNNLEAQQHFTNVAGIEARIAALELEAMEESLGDIAHLEKVYEAGIEQIRSELKTLRYKAGKTRVESPVCWIVTEKHLDSESYVQPGTALLRVGDMDTIEIIADILSADILLIEPGQAVVIEGDILGERNLTGMVRRIYPHGFTVISALGIEQQRFRTVIDFDNTRVNLPPGADLDVRIIIEEREDTLYVPSAAVFMTADGPAVFLVKNGRARIRNVETGLAGDDKVEVISGLEDGHRVILRPPPELGPGDRVSIR